MLGNPAFQKTRRQHQSMSPLILAGAVLILTAVVGLVCAWLMAQTVASYYAFRMYPNVYAMGVKLGRLTPEEATALLSDATYDATAGTLTLSHGENHWSLSASDAGMQLDVASTVQAAFAVGHTGDLGWRDRAREWLKRHDIAPVFTVDPEQARQMLKRLAPSLATPSIDATLRLPQNAGDPVVGLPGQPGRELDVEATLAQLLAVTGGQAQSIQVELVFRTIPPRVADVTRLQSQVEKMLNRRIKLSTFDVLTDERFSWTLGRTDIIKWLCIVPGRDGPAVVLDEEAIHGTLVGLADELGEGRGFRWAEAAEQVRVAFDAGGGDLNLYLTHPERIYVVQPGDSLSSIAAAFGMTPWHVMRANPDIDHDWLHVGQQLVIPSQDELTPFSPVPNKRIIVSTAEQRMRAYENGELEYDWPVSTGVTESPTHTGVFQVLSKEENAYASLWDLWMPHFVAIYAAGPDFYNGLHGLPTLSSGRRLWEGLLGSPASYGCIILGLEEAEALYTWAELGTVVIVQ
jgi:lipoprotein-anchoring transpeptidase ErfK/SrfK